MRLQAFGSSPWCRTAALVLLGACAVSGATAQESDTEEFDGRWTASFAGQEGGRQKASRQKANRQRARVVIANFGGTWQDQSGPRDGVSTLCRGKTFPITVQVSKPSEFEFTVWGSSVSPECPDLSLSVQPAGPTTLHGTIGRREAVTLVRQEVRK